MKIITPNYYHKFKCIAEACRHSCCIGWEIDIDGETYALYQNTDGPLGKRLKESISTENSPHFILDGEERCPFLNESGLCDIITALGEDALCDICADHPRFRNYFSERIEMGLGLCCEEAARIVLTQTEPFALSDSSFDGTVEEQRFFAWRNEIFALLQNRSLPIEQRLEMLLKRYGKPIGETEDWAPFYKKLERLDPLWDGKLKQMGRHPIPSNWTIPTEQLTAYFLYRHLADGLEDGLCAERVAFAVLSTRMVLQITAAEKDRSETLAEIARMYSAEVEYSDENISAILNRITSS